MSFSRTWIPNQHGAWAFLVTPVVVGALAGGPSAWDGLLLITWLAAYCLNFYVAQAVKSRKPKRYQRQLALYGIVSLILGLPLVQHDPSLLLLLMAAIPAFAVNLVFIRQRNERAWANDFVGIALAAVVGYGAYALGAHPTDPVRVAWMELAIALYFGGTVIYVKTMIRERGSRIWMRLSYAYHGALVLLATLAQWWPGAAIALLLLVRAIAVPRLGWTPKRIGLTEIAFTVAVALSALTSIP